jgi:hypothetical protein
MRRHSLDTLLIYVYFGSKFRPSSLEVAGLRVPARYIRTLLCSVSAPHVEIVPLLVVYQLLIFSARTLAYLELKLFLIIFVGGCFFILKYECTYIYIFPRSIMTGVVELLLLSKLSSSLFVFV